jgi:HK97 family phage major capsid protein
MNVHAIRESRAAKVKEARALVDTAQAQSRQLTEQETKAFDDIKAIITGLDAEEARAAFVDAAERRSMGSPVADKARDSLEARISLVDAINAQIENRSITGALPEFNQEQKRQGVQARGVLIPQSLFEKRAAQTTTTGAGIVPDDFKADQFVGLLRNSMLVQSLGARVLPNLRGDVTIPRQASTSSAQWIAEGGALTDTGMSFNSISLTPKHVGAITELSRQLLQQSNPAIEQLVRDDFTQVVSLAVDKAMLHGNGTTEPNGLLTAATGMGSLATLNWEGVLALLESLALENINPNAWLTHPEVATRLRSVLKSSTAGAAYLMEDGLMAGLPVSVTKQLAKVTGTPNTGRLILGDFSEMIVGTWGAVDILTNQFAEGPYSRGAVQVRILTTLDMVPRRENAFIIVDDVSL